MTKSELIAAMAEESGLTKTTTELALSAFATAVTKALQSGDKVQLVGFGTFEVKERGARIGRNPRTKEEIEIPASRVPSFKVGKALKDAVAK